MLLHIIGWDGLNSHQILGLSICESKHLKLFGSSKKTMKRAISWCNASSFHELPDNRN